jgi:hypothetical protein
LTVQGHARQRLRLSHCGCRGMSSSKRFSRSRLGSIR